MPLSDESPWCPWSWRGLHCQRERAHPSPHLFSVEQPEMAAIEVAIEAAARADTDALLLSVLETGPWFRETGGDHGVYWCCGVSAGWMGHPGDPIRDPHDADCPYIKAWALIGTDVMVRDTYPADTDEDA